LEQIARVRRLRSSQAWEVSYCPMRVWQPWLQQTQQLPMMTQTPNGTHKPVQAAAMTLNAHAAALLWTLDKRCRFRRWVAFAWQHASRLNFFQKR
jgi:hypothetical protein